MNQEADVGYRELCHFADFFVAEVALEFEPQNFALILWQRLHGSKHLGHCFVSLERGARPFKNRRERIRVRQWAHSGLLLANVKREVAADCEKPLGQMAADPRRVLFTEPQERLLNHFTSAFHVTENRGWVAYEMFLVSIQRLHDPSGFGLVFHASLTSSNV